MCKEQKQIKEANHNYWGRRAVSYSQEIMRERSTGAEERFGAVLQKCLPASRRLCILDAGTGPGLFSLILAGMGHQVTAIDFSKEMLQKAKENAGTLASLIDFQQMDVQQLIFPSDTFDAVVSRDVTWNLQNPAKAYCEWYRVLKQGGTLINFDAGWYEYLFNERKALQFQERRRQVSLQGTTDLNAYEEAGQMEEISKQLYFSRHTRPESDIKLLKEAGFSSIHVDQEIWKVVWDDVQKMNNGSTPCFMIQAYKK